MYKNTTFFPLLNISYKKGDEKTKQPIQCKNLVLLSRIELESFGYRPSALPLSYRSKNYWKGYMESNHDCWGQIPECYHYTIPHHLKWRPLPDSNWDLNLRRISFYPVELRGLNSGTPTRIQTLITNSVGLRVIQLHYRCIKWCFTWDSNPKPSG